MYKLIAFDLDGTLLDEKHEVTKRTKEALAEIVSMGIKITIATGRVYSSAAKEAQKLGMDLPVICAEGAMVKEAVSGFEHYHTTVDEKLARAVAKFSQERELYVRCYVGSDMYFDRNADSARRLAKAFETNPIQIKNWDTEFSGNPTVISIVESVDTFDNIFPDLIAEFGEILTVTQFTSSDGSRKGAGLINKQSSKGKALSVLADHLGLDRNEIMAFGDSMNDINLMETAGYSVAMGNASDDVKAVADHITDTNRNEGVAKALENLILKQG